MTPEKTIEVGDLPDSIRRERPGAPPGPEVYPDGESMKEAAMRFEGGFILRRLAQNDGNISKTAEQIGIARRNLHRKIRQLGIEVERQEGVS